MASAIPWFLGKFNINLIDAVAVFKDASDVPCDRLMAEAHTSYRRSPQDFSVPRQ